jgi:hypothetical protein
MTWREAALAAQFEAPLRLLGDPGSRVARFSERVAATDPWIDPADLDRLGDPLAWGIPADGGVSVRESKDAALYSIIVSDPMRDVIPFGSVDGRFGLYFEPGLLVLSPASNPAVLRPRVQRFLRQTRKPLRRQSSRSPLEPSPSKRVEASAHRFERKWPPPNGLGVDGPKYR